MVKNILLRVKIIPEIVENIWGIISLRPFAARSDCRIKSLARNACDCIPREAYGFALKRQIILICASCRSGS